jgi:enterobacterial common antigen flippase
MPSNSYGQILRSSSIVGGAQGISYVIAMIRVKLVAVLLGPAGVGLVGLYASITGLMGTIAGLGIDSSGVREVAEAHSSADPERIARTLKTLRRFCWITGLVGWLFTAALSYPLSVWTFDTPDRAWAIALLGGTILLGTLTGGQTALIQGTRRIGDLARLNVLGAIASTFVAVGIYAVLGEKGIVPVFIITAAINLSFAAWFAGQIKTVHVTQTWMETLDDSKRLVSLGIAFMYGALLAALVGLAIRLLIVRHLGLDASGVYQAAWALSGLFAGFIINAMGADFYPRLTAVANNNEQVNKLVNEQIEIGVLLALPGLLGTLIFAPLLMHIFYSDKFMPGSELLPWLAIGVFGQVISFPLGFIQRAKGRTAWIFVSQTHLNLLNLVLSVVMLVNLGLESVAWAFALTTCIHGLVVFSIARHLSAFRWGTSTVGLTFSASAMIGLGFATQHYSSGLIGYTLSALVMGAGCLFSLGGIYARLGADHRLIKAALKIPGGAFCLRAIGSATHHV